MTDFIKKYRIGILCFAILTILIWVIIPYQEKKYLEPDINSIESKSNAALIWTEMTVFGIIFIFFTAKNFKSLEKMLVLTFNLIMLSFGVFLSFTSIFLSATFFLNSFSTSHTIDKNYSVVYIDNNKNDLLLWDIDSKQGIQGDRIIPKDDVNKLNLKDTVILSFKRGLLGFNFEPHFKTIKYSSQQAVLRQQGVTDKSFSPLLLSATVPVDRTQMNDKIYFQLL
jgi:hypothetical protein